MMVTGGGQSQIGNMEGDIAYQNYDENRRKMNMLEDQQQFNQKHTTNEEQRQNRVDQQNATNQQGELAYRNADIESRNENNRLSRQALQQKEDTENTRKTDLGQQAIDVKKAKEDDLKHQNLVNDYYKNSDWGTVENEGLPDLYKVVHNPMLEADDPKVKAAIDTYNQKGDHQVDHVVKRDDGSWDLVDKNNKVHTFDNAFGEALSRRENDKATTNRIWQHQADVADKQMQFKRDMLTDKRIQRDPATLSVIPYMQDTGFDQSEMMVQQMNKKSGQMESIPDNDKFNKLNTAFKDLATARNPDGTYQYSLEEATQKAALSMGLHDVKYRLNQAKAANDADAAHWFSHNQQTTDNYNRLSQQADEYDKLHGVKDSTSPAATQSDKAASYVADDKNFPSEKGGQGQEATQAQPISKSDANSITHVATDKNGNQWGKTADGRTIPLNNTRPNGSRMVINSEAPAAISKATRDELMAPLSDEDKQANPSLARSGILEFMQKKLDKSSDKKERDDLIKSIQQIKDQFKNPDKYKMDIMQATPLSRTVSSITNPDVTY
jgi:hypothetical protein